MLPIPERFQPELRSLEAQILSAFRGVTRDGGVSWSESRIIDHYGTDEEREQARKLDTEASWEDLIDSPAWTCHVGIGGFNFLDPIGFRYYLAAAMARLTRGDDDPDQVLAFVLNIDSDFSREHISLLTQDQAAVVARFLRTMAELYTAQGDDTGGAHFATAYESHWRQWDSGAQPK